MESFTKERVHKWVNELELLTDYAKSQPHAAYSALTKDLTSSWSYLIRTTPTISHLLQPLKDALQMKLVPTLTDRAPPNNPERELFSLPARFGGLAITNPCLTADEIFSASSRISKPLKQAILSDASEYSYELMCDQMNAKTAIHKQRQEHVAMAAEKLELASEKGASCWLTTLPITEFGFTLHKGTFHDALALRYGWPPKHTPTNCECGASFSVDHALSCKRGGFPILRHNEIRDLTENLLTEVCHEVSTEPDLQSITNESFNLKSTNTHNLI